MCIDLLWYWLCICNLAAFISMHIHMTLFPEEFETEACDWDSSLFLLDLWVHYSAMTTDSHVPHLAFDKAVGICCSKSSGITPYWA